MKRHQTMLKSSTFNTNRLLQLAKIDWMYNQSKYRSVVLTVLLAIVILFGPMLLRNHTFGSYEGSTFYYNNIAMIISSIALLVYCVDCYPFLKHPKRGNFLMLPASNFEKMILEMLKIPLIHLIGIVLSISYFYINNMLIRIIAGNVDYELPLFYFRNFWSSDNTVWLSLITMIFWCIPLAIRLFFKRNAWIKTLFVLVLIWGTYGLLLLWLDLGYEFYTHGSVAWRWAFSPLLLPFWILALLSIPVGYYKLKNTKE